VHQGFLFFLWFPLRGHVPAFIDLTLKEGRFGMSKPHLLLTSCPAHALFVLGVVGKGSPSSPERKKKLDFVNINTREKTLQ